jgi:hypothetical protein
VSNTDAANTIVQGNDRKRYWRSRVTQGAAWNAIDSTEAANNATGAFPDDYYTFTITARDAAGNSKTATKIVLLDNWTQKLGRFDHGNGLVSIWGEQFSPNAWVPIYVVNEPTPLVGGEYLPAVGKWIADLKSDENGYISPVTLYHPLMKLPFYLIGDYAGGDEIYQPELDGLSFSNIPGGTTAITIDGQSLYSASVVIAQSPGAGKGEPPPRMRAAVRNPLPVAPESLTAFSKADAASFHVQSITVTEGVAFGLTWDPITVDPGLDDLMVI